VGGGRTRAPLEIQPRPGASKAPKSSSAGASTHKRRGESGRCLMAPASPAPTITAARPPPFPLCCRYRYARRLILKLLERLNLSAQEVELLAEGAVGAR